MTWVDQGLYFTLILNTVAMAIMVPLALYLHGSAKKSFARLFRPNQLPVGSSAMSRLFSRISVSTLDFWVNRLDFASLDEHQMLDRFRESTGRAGCYSIFAQETSSAAEVLRSDPRYVLHLLFYKISAFVLLLGGFCMIWTAVVASTDDYLIRFNLANDPQECAGKATLTACREDTFCEVIGTMCRPTSQPGLYDLSVQNIAPANWRWYFFGFGNLAFSLIAAFGLVKVCRVLGAYAAFASQRQMMRANGYRTVIVSGVDLAADAHEQASATNTNEGRFRRREQQQQQANNASTAVSISSNPPYPAAVSSCDSRQQHRSSVISTSEVSVADLEGENENVTEQRSGVVVEEDRQVDQRPPPTHVAATSQIEKLSCETDIVKEAFLRKYVHNDAYFAPGPGDAKDAAQLFQAGHTFWKGSLGVQKKQDEATGAEVIVAKRSGLLAPTVTTFDHEVDLAGEVEGIAFEYTAECAPDLKAAVEAYEEARQTLEDTIYSEQAWRIEERKKKCEEAEKKKKQKQSAATEVPEEDGVGSRPDNAAAVEEEDHAVMMTRVPSKLFAKVPAVAYATEQLCLAVKELNTWIEQLDSEIRQNRLLSEAEGEAQETPALINFSGSVAIRFRCARTAFEFESLFCAAYGSDNFLSNRRVAIAGTPFGLNTGTLRAHIMKSRVMYFIVTFVFTLLIFFWSIPVALLGSLDNLATMPAPIGPFFVTFTKQVPLVIRGILQAYLPVIVLAVFNIVLPSLIRGFAKLKGYATQREVESSTLKMLSTFMILTGVVLQAVLQGGLFQLSAVVQDPSQEAVIKMFIAVVSPQGGYWYATTLSGAFLSTFLEALQLGPVIVRRIKLKSCTSQKQYDELYKPPELDMTVILAVDSVILAVSMLFHATVPLLSLCGGLYFLMKFWVFRWLLFDVCKPQHRPDNEAVTDLSQYTYMFRLVTVLLIISNLGSAVVVGLQRHIGGLVLCALSSGIAVAVHVFVNLVAGRWDPSLGTARLLLPSASERLEAAAAESQPAVVAEGEDCDSYFPSNKLFRRGVLDPEQVVAEVLAKCSAATLELTWEEENEEEVLTSGASE